MTFIVYYVFRSVFKVYYKRFSLSGTRNIFIRALKFHTSEWQLRAEGGYAYPVLAADEFGRRNAIIDVHPDLNFVIEFIFRVTICFSRKILIIR